MIDHQQIIQELQAYYPTKTKLAKDVGVTSLTAWMLGEKTPTEASLIKLENLAIKKGLLK